VKKTTVQLSMVAAFTAGLAHGALAQQVSVLDPGAHPPSPKFETPFPSEILPLDSSLSWKERFNGDETFNANEVLEQRTRKTGMETMEHSGQSTSMSTESNTVMGMDATGVVKQIKKGQGKVKIKHGPIERLGMPAMTMMFKVEDAAMLENLEKDQAVGFSVDNSSGGFTVTHIMPMTGDGKGSSAQPMAAGEMDARGTVKAIRASQGKVKIEHGPIERLGMPAMTMMFKVEDPTQLESLEKGGTVDFSVDNSSGGFVITNIKPAN